MKTQNQCASGVRESRPSLAAWAVLAGLMFLAGAPALHGQTIGFPAVISPPTIDGVVAGDSGWSKASSTTLGNSDVIVQGASDQNNLYLSVQANKVFLGDVTSRSNVVVLAFGTPGGAVQQIHIFTVPNTNSSYQGISGAIQYWSGTDSGGTVAWTKSATPGWLLNNNVMVSYSSGGPVYLEMAIPLANVQPLTGLKFYVDVVRVVQGQLGGLYAEASWPQNQTQGCSQYVGQCHASSDVPPVGSWGNTTFPASTASRFNSPAQTKGVASRPRLRKPNDMAAPFHDFRFAE